MASRGKITKAQIKLLIGLTPFGGSFNRHNEIVNREEVLTKYGSTVALNAFRNGWIQMQRDRVILTSEGYAILRSHQGKTE